MIWYDKANDEFRYTILAGDHESDISTLGIAYSEDVARVFAASYHLLEALKTVRDSTAVLNHLGPEQQNMIEEAIARTERRS